MVGEEGRGNCEWLNLMSTISFSITAALIYYKGRKDDCARLLNLMGSYSGGDCGWLNMSLNSGGNYILWY